MDRRFVCASSMLLSLFMLLGATGRAVGQRTPDTESSALSSTQQDLASLRAGTATHPVLGRVIKLELTGARLADALDEVARQAGVHTTYTHDVLPRDTRVTVHADAISLGDALSRVLEGTGLDVLVSRSGNLAVVRLPAAERKEEIRTGIIAGRVVEAGTDRPVVNGQVAVDGTGRAITDADGRYRIGDVSPGAHTVSVTAMGYRTTTQEVAVEDGESVVADFDLEVLPTPLDEVVVTGTAFETRVRTVPNPVSVITAREIEQKQANNLSDLLRGEIPGVMALSLGQEDYYSYIFVRGNAGGSIEDLIKIYIDGVEVASPYYLSTIDPRSIERIEVVRGPQSSAIYGSEAASGVLQIFTKKGSPGLARPRVDFTTSAGVVESDHAPSDAGGRLTQDHSVSVTGGGESLSYQAGASYATVGEWVKHYGSKSLNFSGGLRAVQGPFTAELTARWADRDYNWATSPFFLDYPPNPDCPQCGNPDYIDNRVFALTQTTMALTLGYQATPRWQHSLTLGDDQNHWAYHQPQPSYNTPADTLVRLANREFRRRQLRYHTAYDATLGGSATARITAGADYWSYDNQGAAAENLLNAFGAIHTTSSTSYRVTNDGWWNAGYFGMAELGFRDQLYLTLAARVEDNPNLGEDYGRAFVPRLGIAYVRSLGSAQVKLRAQWGKGVRPPLPEARTGGPATATTVRLPNPEIAPEVKTGWDAGLDLYWGDRASFSITRFDEEAKNLIHLELVDLTVVPFELQWRNVGVVSLEGWEIEGELTLGRFTVSANYAYSDNVVRQVDAATAENPDAILLPGDRTLSTPKHSGGGRLGARVGSGRVSLDASVMAGWRGLDYVQYYDNLYGSTPPTSLRPFYVEYPALWKWNLRADQALGERWSAFLRVENLANDQTADISNFNVTPGRTTVLGLSWGW